MKKTKTSSNLHQFTGSFRAFGRQGLRCIQRLAMEAGVDEHKALVGVGLSAGVSWCPLFRGKIMEHLGLNVIQIYIYIHHLFIYLCIYVHIYYKLFIHLCIY